MSTADKSVHRCNALPRHYQIERALAPGGAWLLIDPRNPGAPVIVACPFCGERLDGGEDLHAERAKLVEKLDAWGGADLAWKALPPVERVEKLVEQLRRESSEHFAFALEEQGKVTRLEVQLEGATEALALIERAARGTLLLLDVPRCRDHLTQRNGHWHVFRAAPDGKGPPVYLANNYCWLTVDDPERTCFASLLDVLTAYQRATK